MKLMKRIKGQIKNLGIRYLIKKVILLNTSIDFILVNGFQSVIDIYIFSRAFIFCYLHKNDFGEKI